MWLRSHRQARPKTTGVAGTCKHKAIISVASACLPCQSNSCESFFLQCSSLERASRSLAKTGLFFCLFRVFFLCSFCVTVLGGLQGSFGGHWVDLGAIWEAFRCHFGDFFRLRCIFENVRFTIVKPYFLRSGRVLDHDFFMLCS